MISMKDLVYLAVLLISVVSSYAFLRSDVKALAKDKLDKLEFEKKIAELEKHSDKKISDMESAKAEAKKVETISEEFIGIKKDLERVIEKIDILFDSVEEIKDKLEKHINEEKE